jgi:uncharacterized membrane protein YphA (DoxX/SURF4 family)
MPKNPISDVWQSLTGTTSDHLELGNWRFLLVTLLWLLLVAGLAIAFVNWREDPAQRTGRHIGIAVVRVLIGCMWFEGMLWKLPLPLSGGLQYWTEQEVTRAAFEFHRDFVKDFLLPNLAYFGPVVFLAELCFAASLMLGLAVRLFSILAILFVLQLWLGIYRPGDPAEWPWSYVFLAMLMFFFALDVAGRSLGLDAWLRRNVPSVSQGRGFIGRLLRVAG